MTETERVEQQALAREMEKPLPGQDQKPQSMQASGASSEVIQQYQSLILRLANLRQMDLDLVSKYAQKTEQTPASDELQRNRQIRPQTDQP